jgi:N6-L-threonylcarbamoyladenine synthase
VPSLAARAHGERIESCIQRVLGAANVSINLLDGVSVTRGPGLAGCLAVGLQAAKSLVQKCPTVPLVAINHMEGHALVPRLGAPDVTFPFLALLISGGHTQLVVCKSVGEYALLGDSMDDAVGECIDKVARALKLPFRGGGGKSIESLALQGTISNEFNLQVPLLRTKNCDFSFSGLKTACLSIVESEPEMLSNELKKANFAASFQNTIILHLSDRVSRAAQWCRLNQPSVRHLVISGGVACNATIRDRLSRVAEREGLIFNAPPPYLCTDNGVMIAWAGIENLQAGKDPVQDIDSLRFVPRLPLDPSRTDYFPGSHVTHNSMERQSVLAASKAAVAAGDRRAGLYFSLARDLSRLQRFDEALTYCVEGLKVRGAPFRRCTSFLLTCS